MPSSCKKKKTQIKKNKKQKENEDQKKKKKKRLKLFENYSGSLKAHHGLAQGHRKIHALWTNSEVHHERKVRPDHVNAGAGRTHTPPHTTPYSELAKS